MILSYVFTRNMFYRVNFIAILLGRDNGLHENGSGGEDKLLDTLLVIG